MTYAISNQEKITNRCAALLSERGIASSETVDTVCGICGSSLGTLNDILYYKTGENDVLDYFEDELVAEGLAEHDNEDEDDEEDEEDEEER